MKRMSSLLLAICLSIGLTSCGSKDEGSGPALEPSSDATAGSETKTDAGSEAKEEAGGEEEEKTE